MKNKYDFVNFHLDDFQFAQARKLVANKKGVTFKAIKDDMLPFVKLHQNIIVINPKRLVVNLPIVYWQKTSLLYGFITSIQEEDVMISNIKGFPLEWKISKKHILGKIKMNMPFWFFCWRLKRILLSQKFKVID